MAVTTIKVSNFKSFKNLDVELGNFNVLIGPNASGKSNFIEIFRFLKAIAESGLENASSLQGGFEYLKNISALPKDDTKLNFAISDSREIEPDKVIGFKVKQATYKFSINEKNGGTCIKKDEFIRKGNFINTKSKNKEKKNLGAGELKWVNKKGKLEFTTKSQNIIKDNSISHLNPFPKQKIHEMLLLENHSLSQNMFTIAGETDIFEFDPKIAKKAVPIFTKILLEHDGSNLANVLKDILTDKDRDRKRKLINLLKDTLPFIKEVNVKTFTDKSILFSMQEKYFKGKSIPAPMISNGTVNLINIIVALYFQSRQLAIIEEPERNIHPALISKVVAMMKDASRNKQIIVTTHNPEIVKHADIEDLLLVTRDKDGFSTITRPADKKHVKTFLKNDMGIEELYVQNLLGEFDGQ